MRGTYMQHAVVALSMFLKISPIACRFRYEKLVDESTMRCPEIQYCEKDQSMMPSVSGAKTVQKGTKATKIILMIRRRAPAVNTFRADLTFQFLWYQIRVDVSDQIKTSM